MTAELGRRNVGEREEFEHRYRSVAGLHLLLAGALNLAVGTALVALSALDRTLFVAFDRLDLYASSEWVLRNAETVASAVTVGLAVLGVYFVAVGAAEAYVGRRVRSEAGADRWREGVAVAALGAPNPLALPVAGIAVALLLLGRTDLPA